MQNTNIWISAPSIIDLLPPLVQKISAEIFKQAIA